MSRPRDTPTVRPALGRWCDRNLSQAGTELWEPDKDSQPWKWDPWAVMSDDGGGAHCAGVPEVLTRIESHPSATAELSESAHVTRDSGVFHRTRRGHDPARSLVQARPSPSVCCGHAVRTSTSTGKV